MVTFLRGSCQMLTSFDSLYALADLSARPSTNDHFIVDAYFHRSLLSNMPESYSQRKKEVFL